MFLQSFSNGSTGMQNPVICPEPECVDKATELDVPFPIPPVSFNPGMGRAHIGSKHHLVYLSA